MSIDDSSVLMCIKLSYQVYEDGPPLYSSGDMCIRGLYDGQAMISQNPDGKVIVSFRGTESLMDLVIGLMRRKVDFPYLPGTKVHAGFFLQYTHLRNQLMRHLTKYHVGPLYVTGHSLGGALATMFAADFAVKYPETAVTCYTFGTPRVGDAQFAEAVTNIPNVSISRINNVDDIITEYPWRGFVHTVGVLNLTVGGLRWYNIRTRHSLKTMLEAFTSRPTGEMDLGSNKKEGRRFRICSMFC